MMYAMAGVIALLAKWSDVAQRSLFVAVLAACATTAAFAWPVWRALAHPTSSTSCLAVLVFPFYGTIAAAVAFLVAYLVLSLMRRRRAA